MRSIAAREEEIKQVAEDLYATLPDWITFYRDVLGLRGIIRRRFHTPEALDQFEQTETYSEIQRMLSDLRRRPKQPPEDEPTRVITVRIPKCLHEALRAEAYQHHTSMNKLCISKLLQFIAQERVPPEVGPWRQGEPAMPEAEARVSSM